jgi:mannose-6-phosphate isomerase-like protein (cupin superfamily)
VPGSPRDSALRLIDQLVVADFEQVDKPWGIEYVITLPSGPIIKLIHVKAGARTSMQHHDVKEEIQFVILTNGNDLDSGVVTYENDMVNIHRAGARVLVKPGAIHRTQGPCLLLEVTTPENDDVVRHADDYGRQA